MPENILFSVFMNIACLIIIWQTPFWQTIPASATKMGETVPGEGRLQPELSRDTPLTIPLAGWRGVWGEAGLFSQSALQNKDSRGSKNKGAEPEREEINFKTGKHGQYRHGKQHDG